MADAVRYSATMQWRDQPEIVECVDRAARARGTKPSEYVRQAIRTTLALDGIEPTTNTASDPLTLGRAS